MSTSYYLAVDVRADLTTAAVAEGSDSVAIRTEGAPLGPGSTIPTAIFVTADDLAFGQEARDLGALEPARLIPDFVASAGESATIVVAGEEFAPADLFAWMVDAVVSRVAEARGSRPAAVWVVVPAAWSDERIDAVADAFDRDGHPEVDFITVPEALASRYSQVEPYDTDLTLLVCDVDERELSAALVRATPQGGARPIGVPVRSPISREGGADAGLDSRAADSVARAVHDAGLDIDVVDAIVLSGSTTRLDGFERLLVDRFGDPIGVDPQPGLAAALGAAYALARETIAMRGPAPVPTAAGAAVGSTGFDQTHVVVAPVPLLDPRPQHAWYRRPGPLAALGVALLLASGAAFASVLVLGQGSSAGDEADGGNGGTENAFFGTPQSTLSPSSSPASTPSATAPGSDAGAVDAPQAPANPRVSNPAAPRSPAAPVTTPAPAPPATTAPEAPADPGDPADPGTPVDPAPPVPTDEPTTPPPAEPTTEPTEPAEPTTAPTAEPEPTETTPPLIPPLPPFPTIPPVTP